MRRIAIIALGLAAAATAGCGDEGPTSVGASLIGEGPQTFDLVLNPAEFLVSDTTYDDMGSLHDATFRMVAHDFADTLEAHTLFQVVRPFSITYQDTANVSRTDTLPTLGGADLTVVLDTLTRTTGPVELQVVQVTQSWDPASVTWQLRYDTASTSEPWATPGGTPGEVLADTTWVSGDSLVIHLDSAAAAVWSDTTTRTMGGMVRATTPGARVFVQSLSLTFDVLPAAADTVLTGGGIGPTAIVASPSTPPPGDEELRVGGLPIWRTLLHFKALNDFPVPCSASSTTCTLPLSDVQVNAAVLQLEPVPVGAHLLEDTIRVLGNAVLEAPGVPVTRSPLAPIMSLMQDSVTPALFNGSIPSPPPVGVPITAFVQSLASATAEAPAPVWLALTQLSEGSTFGFAAFASEKIGNGPRLRLVVTVPEFKVTQ